MDGDRTDANWVKYPVGMRPRTGQDLEDHMARYDYRCTRCAKTFEVEHAMGEHPAVSCPECGARASRVFSASGISFKGTGFYNTDQRRKHVGSVGSSSCNCGSGNCSSCN